MCLIVKNELVKTKKKFNLVFVTAKFVKKT